MTELQKGCWYHRQGVELLSRASMSEVLILFRRDVASVGEAYDITSLKGD